MSKVSSSEETKDGSAHSLQGVGSSSGLSKEEEEEEFCVIVDLPKDANFSSLVWDEDGKGAALDLASTGVTHRRFDELWGSALFVSDADGGDDRVVEVSANSDGMLRGIVSMPQSSGAGHQSAERSSSASESEKLKGKDDREGVTSARSIDAGAGDGTASGDWEQDNSKAACGSQPDPRIIGIANYKMSWVDEACIPRRLPCHALGTLVDEDGD
jgi:hypothetical protein